MRRAASWLLTETGIRTPPQAMLPKIDVFIGSEFYYKALFVVGRRLKVRGKPGKSALARPFRGGVRSGDKGSAVKWDGGYFAPGYHVDVVDTVGAGRHYTTARTSSLSPAICGRTVRQFTNAVATLAKMQASAAIQI